MRMTDCRRAPFSRILLLAKKAEHTIRSKWGKGSESGCDYCVRVLIIEYVVIRIDSEETSLRSPSILSSGKTFQKTLTTSLDHRNQSLLKRLDFW